MLHNLEKGEYKVSTKYNKFLKHFAKSFHQSYTPYFYRVKVLIDFLSLKSTIRVMQCSYNTTKSTMSDLFITVFAENIDFDYLKLI